MLNRRERAGLDRYITGNYGEDQFRESLRDYKPWQCEKCDARVIDLSPEELGWEYCPNCTNPRVEEEPDYPLLEGPYPGR